MGLTDYRRKRHFERTPEPRGAVVNQAKWSYVIQKHAATRLHYDFRLELGGVLKSWAVPKGPCLDPAIKRLAVEVEDHPVDYGDFEGTIPQGQYGGGTVMVWDTGTWEPVGDPEAGYRQGKLKFQLHGKKLSGGWMLVRSRSRRDASSTEWLLMKERDEEAQPLSEGDVLVDAPLSAASGRDLDAIADAKDPVWSSEASTNGHASIKSRRRATKGSGRHARGEQRAANEELRKEKLPKTWEPQLATLTKSAPVGDEWLHEVKFDGYRMVCRIDGDDITFISRNGKDWTKHLHPLAEAIRQLPMKAALLDGEVVALRDDGTSDFQALQNAFRDGAVQDLYLYLFDVLHLDGYRLRDLPLVARKEKLAALFDGMSSNGRVRYSDHIAGQGGDFARQACRQHLEGIISKRGDRPYQSGRGYDWLKVKCVKEEEVVIGGYTDPSGSRHGFGALLLGYYDSAGRLQYAGKVGTGFDDRTLDSLLKRMQGLQQKEPAFSDRTHLTATQKSHWLKPELVAQIVYSNRTRDGLLRHATFLGLREDKPAKEVTFEEPVPVDEAVAKANDNAAGKTRHRSPRKGKNIPEKSKEKDDLYDAASEKFAGVRLTSPDKTLYPQSGLTKLDLAAYYRDVADWILPDIRHRPLVLVRCPDGQQDACFYQKHPGAGTPSQLRQLPIREKNKREPYVLVDDVKGLIALAQVGALEIHAWGSREDRLEKPDRLIFDLDPDPSIAWKTVVNAARQLRDFLGELGLESFVKTTGGKGLHLVVPIDRRHEWDEAKDFCELVADTVVSIAPKQYTANMSKAARKGKIFLDYLRNARGATAIVPYSPRARENASVSAPLSWKELSPKITSDHFTISTIRRRLASLKQDPWEELTTIRQTLTQPIKQLHSISRASRK